MIEYNQKRKELPMGQDIGDYTSLVGKRVQVIGFGGGIVAEGILEEIGWEDRFVMVRSDKTIVHYVRFRDIKHIQDLAGFVEEGVKMKKVGTTRRLRKQYDSAKGQDVQVVGHNGGVIVSGTLEEVDYKSGLLVVERDDQTFHKVDIRDVHHMKAYG